MWILIVEWNGEAIVVLPKPLFARCSQMPSTGTPQLQARGGRLSTNRTRHPTFFISVALLGWFSFTRQRQPAETSEQASQTPTQRHSHHAPSPSAYFHCQFLRWVSTSLPTKISTKYFPLRTPPLSLWQTFESTEVQDFGISSADSTPLPSCRTLFVRCTRYIGLDTLTLHFTVDVTAVEPSPFLYNHDHLYIVHVHLWGILIDGIS